MAQFANIRIELDKITRLKDVKNLKMEVNRLAQELKKRGEDEVAHVERTVKQVRVRVLRLGKQVEREVTKIRSIIKDATQLKTGAAKRGGKKAAAKGRKKSGARKTRATTKKA